MSSIKITSFYNINANKLIIEKIIQIKEPKVCTVYLGKVG